VERLARLLALYDAKAPLDRASTIPADWYRDADVAHAERRTVFGGNWHAVGRAEQVAEPGSFLTAEVGGEPVLVARGSDRVLRGFFNVCRHHAAAVAEAACGTAERFRCPYHGWTYALDGSLLGTPDFDGVKDFDRGRNGLLPLAVECWASFVFVRLETGPNLQDELEGLHARVAGLDLERFRFFERRSYELDCNWKVFVDNYLDGGYHVPHLHKKLDSVLRYSDYTIETGDRFCIQSSPIESGADAQTAALRAGERAFYLWVYPNFMLNAYGSAMDTNLVVPLGVDRTRVVFDFYFDDVSKAALEKNRRSVTLSESIQHEDVAVCEAVQRGLGSRAYRSGRLSVRREAGEHLFHRLLARDLERSLAGV